MLRRLEANHTKTLDLPKSPSHPCCNSRSSPTYPSPLERKHERHAHIQRFGVISLERSQRKWASSRLEGRTSWIFSSCGMCSRLTMGNSGTHSGGLRKGQSPCELLGGHSGFLCRRCRCLRPCVESVAEPEDSTPMQSWILWYFWSLPRGVSPRLEWRHARALSSRAEEAVSHFPSRGSRDQGLSLEASSGSFPKRFFHEAFPQVCPKCHCGVSRSSA